jgi:hypothetical protein
LPMLTLLFAVALASGALPPPPAVTISASDRKAILSELRVPVEKRLGKRVVFVVTTLRVERDWAFAQVEPQRPGSRKIDGRVYFPDEWEYMDGLTTTAILRKRGARWRILAMKIGALDAWYCGHFPAEQFDPCKP